MAIIPGLVVPAPEPLEERYGLFTAALGPVELPTHGRAGGVSYESVACGTARAYPIGCYDGQVEVPEGGKTGEPNNATVEASPFIAIATLECGALGFTGTEFEAKVRRRLENGEQGAVEAALWTGLGLDGDGLEISSLSDTAEDVSAADEVSITGVVAALEDYAYRDQGYGSVAYIHAPVSVAAWAAEAGLIVPDGTGRGARKRTPYGSVWVFGGGYPGTGEDGAAAPAGGAFIHITGQTTVWRSNDMHVFPADQTMNRTTNQRLLVAEREYAVSFDCFNGRAEFDPLGSS